MKKNALIALLLILNAWNFSSSAYAQVPGVVLGKPQEIFADPSDVVVQLDNEGPCGPPSSEKSKYFHIQRAKANFKEVTAVLLTAFTFDKGLRLFVESCSGNRNILSHAGVRVE